MSEALFHEGPVLFSDCDPAGIAFTPKLLARAEHGFEHWLLRTSGRSRLAWGREGIRFLTERAVLDFSRPVRHGQPLRSEVKVEALEGGVLTLRHRLVDPRDGALHAEGLWRWSALDSRGSGLPFPFPVELP